MTRFQLLPSATCSLLLAGPIGLAYGAPGDTELISVNAADNQAAGYSGSFVVAVSSDARFVGFMSTATTLIPNDTDSTQYVYVRDRLTGQTERTIQSYDDFAMSADGRFIVVANAGIVVYDRQTAKSERVDVSSTGTVANKLSLLPAINANGRYVAFLSEATNLVPNSNNTVGVFVHDRQTGITTKVSVSSSGEQANGASFTRPSINADGRFVAFGSEATNLVANDTNGSVPDVFVRDRQLAHTEIVSVDSNGQQLGASNTPAISADGQHVCFGGVIIYVHDRGTGQTELASVASDGTPANGGSEECAISADGRYIAFFSGATNLAARDSNGLEDIFWHDMLTGKTERVSVASNGAQSNGASLYPAISADGLFVAFWSAASNLTANDPNKTDDIYLHEPGGPSVGPETVGYTLRPTAMDFGTHPVSSSSIRNFFLKNTGNVPLPVSSVALLGTNSDQFAMVSFCGSSVAVSVTCRIRIYFRPTSVGHKVAQLKVVAGNKPPRFRTVTATGQ